MSRTPSDRGPSWEMISGIVAIFVGLGALGITAYTAYLQRKQAQAAVWPRLVFDHSDTPNYRITLHNKGVGPAIIRDIKLTVDGKPVHGWFELFERITGARAQEINAGALYSSIGYTVLSAGELIEAYKTQTLLSPAEQEQYSRRVQSSICYCSIFDECWALPNNNSPVPVARCPIPGADSFQQ